MNGGLVIMALVSALGVAVLSPVFGYGAEVRARMMVRNLAPVQFDDSVRPLVARDAAAGAGIFEYSEGPMGFGWPMICAGQSGLPYNIAMLDSNGSLLSRTSIPEWTMWDSVVNVAEPGFEPKFETQNIASSPQSQKVCITWVRTDTSPMPGYYRLSSDAGATWGPIQELERPPAYGGDTVTSFHVSSLHPFYDDNNRLHVMAAVHPVVHDTAFIMPAGIWHWCPDWSPSWRLIRRAGCSPEHLAAPVGYNALYACRPSGMWFNEQRVVLAVWEQFDSVNVDPLTNLLRAGIHFCSFDEQGISDTMCIAQPDSCSCRFPAVAAYRSGSEWDTAFVQYEIDQVAGFYPLGQGACTNNPIAVRRVPLYMPSHLGQLDTIGGTTYDLQTCGPAHPMLSCAPGYGVHALWAYSSDTSRTFPNLNSRYNFYDFAVRAWNWIDPDYMQSGVNVFPYRSGLGCMDVEPTTGIALISGCTPPPLPHIAVEENPKPQASSSKPVATIVRGVMFLGAGHNPIPPGELGLCPKPVLLDATGRAVMSLSPGANDVSRLAPGVYFVLQASGAKRDASSVTKVVLAE